MTSVEFEKFSVSRDEYIKAIKEIMPDLDESYYTIPLEMAGIDSIDLVALRSSFETISGEIIPDSSWLSFRSLSDIISYCMVQQTRKEDHTKRVTGKKIIPSNILEINMPQMSMQALSESWLFKELGDRHWKMLCEGLHVNSTSIRDIFNNRLYATFVRIRIQCSNSLGGFEENDQVAVTEEINRYGNGIYFSKIQLSGDTSYVHADLMSSFAARNNTDNTQLMKSQPFVENNDVPSLHMNSSFGTEYREVKKKEIDLIQLDGQEFLISPDILFETEYEINPYYDLNGVGLLYFAAYPIINDICETRFFRTEQPSSARWETEWLTHARDVFYYGNCNAHETLIYRLHSYKNIGGDRIHTSSSISRKTDGKLIAQLFTIKQKRVPVIFPLS